MSSTVALVLQMESAKALEAVAKCMPVWIADTAAHLDLKNSLARLPNAPPVTWFPLRHQETFEEVAARIVFSLDDHYNELAQKNAYKFLLLFGVQHSEFLATQLGELDFSIFEPTAFGFVAAKVG